MKRRYLQSKGNRRGFSLRHAVGRLLKSGQAVSAPDYILVGVIAIIVLTGVLMLSSASSVKSFHNFDGDTYVYFRHQLLYGLLPGTLAFLVMAKLDYRRWQRYTLHF